MILFSRNLSHDYIKNNKTKFLEKLTDVVNQLETLGKDVKTITGYSKDQLFGAVEHGRGKTLEKAFNRLANVYSIDNSYFYAAHKDLPTDLEYHSVYEKLNYLNDYLTKERGLPLARAISMKEASFAEILSYDKKPKKGTLKKIAEYFLMTVAELTDDSKLPAKKDLLIDEDLYKVQVKDVDDRVSFFKNRHYIRKNYRVLGYGKRVKLVLSLLAVMVPLIAYTGYCATLVSSERISTMDKYRKGSAEEDIYDTYDKEQVERHQKLQETDKAHNPDAYYLDVKVGSRLYKISNISYSTNSYVTRMELYFKFDKAEFEAMFKHYTVDVLGNLVLEQYESENPTQLKPDTTKLSDWLVAHDTYVNTWVRQHAKEYYPGETPSNVLTDKQTMFDIGNGGFVADSYGTVKELEEVEYVDAEGNAQILCYQKVKFEAQFEKAFDSYRYPLDSIQLKMYIQPTMDANYMRYTPDRDVNSYGESISGFSSFFRLGNGYRLVKNANGVKNFTQNVNYYMDVNNDPATSDEYAHTYKTQLEVIVRANRHGISLFLQAFVNLFSVTIWICIAFYNQSYNGEDSIGMLGTGLFGAISSVLVGISMVSDAGIFSLITMINIFTLAVIMIMTYQSIAARRAVVKQDKVLIAYNGVKLRITFFLLIITTAIMFAGLPLISYLFGI